MKNQPLLLTILLLLLCLHGKSDVTLPRLISDGMVLQRQTNIKIWGWASVGEKVIVRFIDSTYITNTGADGNWTITLPPHNEGGPFEMVVTGANTITIHNILIGDVWLCSGQSNMELNMERASPLYQNEINNSDNPYIRQFTVPKSSSFNVPLTDISGGTWVAARPETIRSFSAVAYFFALELYNKYKIPIGLINSSLGGSPAEAWISETAIKSFPHYDKELQRFKDQEFVDSITKTDKVRIQQWYDNLAAKDAGYNKTITGGWNEFNPDTSGWMSYLLPGYWKGNALEGINGSVWFKKNFVLPDSVKGRAAKLNLGRIVDADSVYINGVFVGTTSYQYPPRRYKVPSGILRSGVNTIVVKVICSESIGGFVPDKPYELIFDNLKVDLAGKWYYRIGAIVEPLRGPTFVNWKPVGLFNAMIHPLLNYNIKGVVWYQGESNVSRTIEYYQLLPTLIRDWRKNWNQGDFPFILVQLPNYGESSSKPQESSWARFREAQFNALSLNKTAMAVTIDLGEWNDIHPLNKKDVGLRLALAARHLVYNEKYLIFSGPVFQSMTIDGNRIILSFNHTGKGLTTKKTEILGGFAIADNDKKFAWAKAEIIDNKVIVWNDSIQNPVAVRYAWADNPVTANLYNSEGLPAVPFRSDDW